MQPHQSRAPWVAAALVVLAACSSNGKVAAEAAHQAQLVSMLVAAPHKTTANITANISESMQVTLSTGDLSTISANGAVNFPAHESHLNMTLPSIGPVEEITAGGVIFEKSLPALQRWAANPG